MESVSLGRRVFIRLCGAGLLAPSWSTAGTAEAQGDPWSGAELIEPNELAGRIAAKEKLSILYVGFPVLYRAAHITDAILAGPASKPEGIELLKEASQDLDRGK